MTKRLFVGLFILASAAVAFGQAKPSIQGVWRVTETVGGRGTASPTAKNAHPQPGLYIFTAKHYSLTRETGDKPRVAAKDLAKPSLAELQEQGRFAAQAGTYDVSGDTITFHRIVAYGIANMTTTLTGTSTFKLDGKTLALTTKNADGTTSSITMTRVE